MKLIQLVWSQIAHSKWTHLMSVLLVSLGVIFTLFAGSAEEYIKNITLKKISGIDLIVGAKGSPLQLVLANALHLDNPTGNISAQQVQIVSRNPQVKAAVPLAYGDYYRDFRILGTDSSFSHLYELQLAQGNWNKKVNEVVIGHTIGQVLGLNLGDTFHGNHGDSHGHAHEEDYKVVGILSPSETVADQLILTSLSTIWHTHHTTDHSLTALLVTCKTPMAKLTFPNFVNEKTNLQAAIPTIEINRLLSFLDYGFVVIRVLGFALILFAGISLFVQLLLSMSKRKYDLALFRTLGASPVQCAVMVILEPLIIVFIGIVLGAIGSLALPSVINTFLPISLALQPMLTMQQLVPISGIFFAIAIIAAIIPAFQAYKTQITSLLNHA